MARRVDLGIKPMMRAYSNPKRESDKWSLPDLEVWEDNIAETHCRCGECEIPAQYSEDRETCPSCERALEDVPTPTGRTGWFYWYCLPGCLPDSDVIGPFASEELALADARGYDDEQESLYDEDEDETED